MIGWSWLLLAGVWVNNAGLLGAILGFTVSSVMCILVGLTYAELTSALPFVGGEIVYSYRALGYFWSWVTGWAITFAYVGIVAFEGIAAVAVNYLFPIPQVGYLWTIAGAKVYLSLVCVGVISGVFLCYLNYKGIKYATTFQNIASITLVIAG